MRPKLTVGPQPAQWFENNLYRVQWRKEKPPESYRCKYYRTAYYKGEHVGELFRGRSGVWFGVVFGRPLIFNRDCETVAQHMMVGMIVGWQA